MSYSQVGEVKQRTRSKDSGANYTAALTGGVVLRSWLSFGNDSLLADGIFALGMMDNILHFVWVVFIATSIWTVVFYATGIRNSNASESIAAVAKQIVKSGNAFMTLQQKKPFIAEEVGHSSILVNSTIK